MLTGISEGDWALILKVCAPANRVAVTKGAMIVCLSKRCTSSPSRTSPGAGCRSGSATGMWKRFSRPRDSCVFEALAELNPSAHLVQMFDSIVVRTRLDQSSETQ